MNAKSLVGENHCCLARGISSNCANSLEFEAKSRNSLPTLQLPINFQKKSDDTGTFSGNDFFL